MDCGIHRLLDLSQTWARNIAPLRSGMHTVIVQITAGDELIVGLDGEQAMQQAEPGLPGIALAAFTAGTDTATDNDVIGNVAISASG